MVIHNRHQRPRSTISVVLLAGLLAAALSTQVLAVGSGSFSPHPTTPAFGAGYSTTVVLGDLDGDGDLDALVANTNLEAETVWLNDGSGSFSPHPTTPAFGAGQSFDVTLGDLDGDGDLDALVANDLGEPETVWLNDGGGGFSPHPTTPAFGAGHSLAVTLGDLDGDGDLDALVANTNLEAETVWLNDGSGSFSPHPTTPAFGAGQSHDVGLGDLDGDGDLDALVTNYLGEPETVWLNDGSGSFSPHPTTPAFGAGQSFDVALGDLDGDGDLDALVTNDLDEPETVWLNDGSGSFSPHPTTPAFGAGQSFDVGLGDLDGDGDLDALVANDLGEPETVWLNDGSGSFSPHPTTPAFGAGHSLAVALGDLDGDGDLDALVANYLDEPETVWLNRDRAGVSVTPTAVSIAEGGASASYQVVLTSQPTADVTIAVASDGQITANPSSLTFTAANWSVAQTVSLTAVDDATVEGTHSSTIRHSAVSADTAYNGISIATGTATIADNDRATSHVYLPLVRHSSFRIYLPPPIPR